MTLASPAQAELDSFLYDSLTVLDAKNRYPRESRTYVRVDLCHRQYWHTLFDICPKALDVSPPDGLDIFEPFMAWAAEHKFSFDWSYYLAVYEWLTRSKFRDRLTDELLIEMMGASAARWATLNRSSESGIVIGAADRPWLVIGWKCREITGGREVELVELEEPLPNPDGLFGYFTTPGFEVSDFPGWRPIPR